MRNVKDWIDEGSSLTKPKVKQWLTRDPGPSSGHPIVEECGETAQSGHPIVEECGRSRAFCATFLTSLGEIGLSAPHSLNDRMAGKECFTRVCTPLYHPGIYTLYTTLGTPLPPPVPAATVVYSAYGGREESPGLRKGRTPWVRGPFLTKSVKSVTFGMPFELRVHNVRK